VSIAQAAFLLEREETDRQIHEVTDATDHLNRTSATASVGIKAIEDNKLRHSAQFKDMSRKL